MGVEDDPLKAELAEVKALLRRQTEQLAEQGDTLARLEVVVRTKVSAPVVSLSTDEAAEVLGRSTEFVRRLLRAGVFTDGRGGRGSGTSYRLLADEVETYRLEGEDAVRRLRQAAGRV